MQLRVPGPVAWALGVGACILAAAFAVVGFPRAFPSAPTGIAMTRAEALARAEVLAARHGFEAAGGRQAASFASEGRVQTFVELEGGGPEAWRRLVEGELYWPHTWRVRLFEPGEAGETIVAFTPRGEDYGFWQTLPEERPGPALEPEAARALALAGAAAWGIELEPWEPVEAERSERESGRVDHGFAYRHREARLGDGELRLWLGVSGDRFTQLNRYVHVPEAFERRYANMRGANQLLQRMGNVGTGGLMLGGAAAAFWLVLAGVPVLWRRSLAAAAVVAGLSLLAGLNQWPLAWMRYDTALGTDTFTLRFLARELSSALGWLWILGATFLMAEVLTRRAFPERIRLWRLWSPAALRTPEVARETALGLCLVGVFFAYEVGLYALAREQLGWWLPIRSQEAPDALGTFFPWLAPLAVSLRAGLWEECLFRALPIASAAILGERLGHRRAAIGVAVVLQAVVFGLAHASYPAQPATARVLELIAPSLLFAGLYLRFGLLSAVLLHFYYDLVWFALPVWAGAGEGAGLDRALMLAAAAVPLLLPLLARAVGGGADVEALRNRAQLERGAALATPVPERVPFAPSRAFTAVVWSGALLGLASWLAFARFALDVPALSLSRAEASAAMDARLAREGVALDPSWQRLVGARGGPSDAARFVWEQAPEAFPSLLGRHLPGPRWVVRRARFEGPVAERVEEHGIALDGRGALLQAWHRLPEAREAPGLAEEAARRLAQAALTERFGRSAAALQEVGAERIVRSARHDWAFVYRDRQAWSGPEGEARLRVDVAGDRVVDAYGSFEVPERWARAQRERRSRLALASAAAGPAMALLMAGTVVWIARQGGRRFVLPVFAALAIALVLAGGLGTWNAWPRFVAGFTTAQEWRDQVLQLALGRGVQLMGGLVLALGAGLLAVPVPRGPSPGLAAAVAVGVLSAGFRAARSAALESGPVWGSVEAAGSRLPWLSELLNPVGAFVVGTVFLLAAYAVLDWLTDGFRRRRIPVGLLFVVLIALLVEGEGASTASARVVAGLASGAFSLAVYVFFLRHDLSLLPLTAGVSGALYLLPGAFQAAHPGAPLGVTLAALAVALLGLWWTWKLRGEGAAES